MEQDLAWAEGEEIEMGGGGQKWGGEVGGKAWKSVIQYKDYITDMPRGGEVRGGSILHVNRTCGFLPSYALMRQFSP